MEPGRISEGTGGSPGLSFSSSDKGGIQSVPVGNHIAYEGSDHHPKRAFAHAFSLRFFMHLQGWPAVRGSPGFEPPKCHRGTAFFGRHQPPKTTACMIRPGTNVNRPAITSAPAKIEIIVILWARTLWRRAARTPNTSMIGVKIDSRWIGLQGPNSLIWWIQNELSATTAISTTQIQPSVRCGSVPLGAANCTTPSTNAAIAAKA